MAAQFSDIAREVLTNALQGVGGNSNGKTDMSRSNGGLSGLKGVAAGAGAAALAPLALKKLGGLGIGGLGDAVKAPAEAVGGAASKVGDHLISGAKDKAKDAVSEAINPGEIVKGLLPGGGGGGKRKQDTEGVGKGRRMPIQQSVDVGLPIETVYNQWTQFQEWPKFMHRVKRVSQEDPCKVSFAVKIWGKTKEFTAEIDTQRPNDRIKWKTNQGMTHTGVVAFRELGPNLTRVLLSFDVDPGSLIEKYARGARYMKRAARADLHRFVAFIEMLEHETGAWRGLIEDGELVEDHDPKYDKKREYGSADEIVHGRGSEEDGDSKDNEGSGRNGGEPRSRSGRSSSRSASAGRSSSSRSGSSGRSSPKRSSSSGRTSAKRTSSSGRGSTSSRGASSPRSANGRSSGSTSSRSSGGARSRGTTRSSSRSSASEHQGRSRSRSSRS